jgi:uncharacterized membrane protein YphA (DoxX/SURF4 family)
MLETRDASLESVSAGTGAVAMKQRDGAAPATKRQVFYWVTTVVAALAFDVPGVLNLIRSPHVAQDMAHLGYPPYFLSILGTWKVLAAIAIVAPRFPRLKEWAYAGMIFDLTGAALSRAAIGDGAPMVAVPLMIAGVVLASWSLRPPSRRLQSARQV